MFYKIENYNSFRGKFKMIFKNICLMLDKYEKCLIYITHLVRPTFIMKNWKVLSIIQNELWKNDMNEIVKVL